MLLRVSVSFISQFAQRRRAWRAKEGAVEISTPGVSWQVDLREDGEFTNVGNTAVLPGQYRLEGLVTEMMILANQAVAEYGAILA